MEFFSRERLIKHHVVSRTWFPFYLKELEFRFNHRRIDIVPATCQYPCDFIPHVPNRDPSLCFLDNLLVGKRAF